MLSEISESQKDKDLCDVCKRGKLIEAVSRMVVVRGWWMREMGSCYSMGVRFQLYKTSSRDLLYNSVLSVNNTMLYI